MNYKLIKKIIILLYALFCVNLITAVVLLKGNPAAAAITATVLVVLAIISVSVETKASKLEIPEPSLAMDIMVIMMGLMFLFHVDEASILVMLPAVILALAAAILDVVCLFGLGEFKGKTLKGVFNEQLRLPLGLDLVLLFWPLKEGFSEGWDTFEAIDYVLITLIVLDIIHNIVILPSVYRKEKQIVTDYFMDLEKEKKALEQVCKEKIDIDDDAKQLLVDRINLIDKILISRMSGNISFIRKTEKEVEKIIADRSSFIESLALHYIVSHPEAVSKLQECGLSQYEIGLCCLYYMGFNGKEVKEISDTSMVYHVNSTIRQKLGLNSTDENLSTYIRGLFKLS